MKNIGVFIVAVLIFGLLGSPQRKEPREIVDPDAKNINQLYKIEEEKEITNDDLLAEDFKAEFGDISVEDISRINSDYFLNIA